MERKILLNPGPATTTDTVKMAQVIPDICPREKDFIQIIESIRDDLVRIVHGDHDKYTSVLFCGSGTINIDVCINSLLPASKKILIINNGSYSARAVEVCEYYGVPYIDLKLPYDRPVDTDEVNKVLEENADVALVHTTHHETGTGVLNPVCAIGEIAHSHNCIFTVDTTSSYAMIPIDIEKDNIDFCMASAQKGLMAMTGLSFVIGKRDLIKASKFYPKRSYYCNLYMQYNYFERTGEMHFTPPVQTIYAAKQGIKEYYDEGENGRWQRHLKVFNAIHEGLDKLGFQDVIKREYQSGLVVSVRYPDDPSWNFEAIHDYCYKYGFTIYPGKISGEDTFRLCALGAIDESDIQDFFIVFRKALLKNKIKLPVSYNSNSTKDI